jgi:hypothetical protein
MHQQNFPSIWIVVASEFIVPSEPGSNSSFDYDSNKNIYNLGEPGVRLEIYSKGPCFSYDFDKR